MHTLKQIADIFKKKEIEEAIGINIDIKYITSQKASEEEINEYVDIFDKYKD